MNKSILIVLSTLMFSCSTNGNDGIENENNEIIAGTWKVDRIEFLADGSSFDSQFYGCLISFMNDPSCFNQSNIKFNSNNTVTYNCFTDINGPCELSNDISAFTWSFLGGVTYELNFTKFGEQNNQTYEIRITNNNLMEMKNTEGSSISYWEKI